MGAAVVMRDVAGLWALVAVGVMAPLLYVPSMKGSRSETLFGERKARPLTLKWWRQVARSTAWMLKLAIPTFAVAGLVIATEHW